MNFQRREGRVQTKIAGYCHSIAAALAGNFALNPLHRPVVEMSKRPMQARACGLAEPCRHPEPPTPGSLFHDTGCYDSFARDRKISL